PPTSIPTIFPYTTLFRSKTRWKSTHRKSSTENRLRSDTRDSASVAGSMDSPLLLQIGRLHAHPNRRALTHIERMPALGIHAAGTDRKSTRLSSSHQIISY